MNSRQSMHTRDVPARPSRLLATLAAGTALLTLAAPGAAAGAILDRAASTAVAGVSAVPVASSCQATSVAVRKQNAAAERTAKRLLGGGYTRRVRTFTPAPTSTKGFTGFETIVVHAPKGTSPVVGYFSLRGTQPCSLVVASAGVVLRRGAYVVRLRFPGEQGTPGRVTVTLVSR